MPPKKTPDNAGDTPTTPDPDANVASPDEAPADEAARRGPDVADEETGRGVSASPSQRSEGDKPLAGEPGDTVTGYGGGPVQAAQGTPDEDDTGSLLADLRDAIPNLSPSEVPPVNELASIVGALVHYIQHDTVPEPLEERFPPDER
jgi:hypothetical protein